MKSQVLVVWQLKGLWHVHHFNTRELLCVTSNKQNAVDKAVALKDDGYRIFLEEQENLSNVFKRGKARNAFEAKLKGMFDHAHLRFTRTKIVKE